MFGLISIKEFAKELGKSESTVRTWKRRGELPPFLFREIGSSVYVRVEKMKEWIENGA